MSFVRARLKHANEAQEQNANMRMKRKSRNRLVLSGTLGVITGLTGLAVGFSRAAEPAPPAHAPVDHTLFTTSMHCIACHSKVFAPNGEDISIGYQWRASIMANSSRDPDWQAGILHQTMEHSNAQTANADQYSTFHLP